MSVKNKLKSTISKKQPFYCLTYSWGDNSLHVHQDQQQYFAQLMGYHDQLAITKRAQCYVGQLFKYKGKQYAIYLTSYGDFRQSKFIYGQNPISKQFGICMFDFVYLFLQQPSFAAKKIQVRITELQKLQHKMLVENMRDIMKKLFRKDKLTNEQLNKCENSNSVQQKKAQTDNLESNFQNDEMIKQ